MAQRERGTASARAGGSRNAGTGRGSGSVRPEPGLSGAQLAALRTRLRALVEPVAAEAGLNLEDFTIARAGRRFVVRVTVDGENGVSHDELSEVSRDISVALDEAEQAGGEFVADSYTLEVSSPGVDRPLTLPRHWRRSVGRLVKARIGGQTLTARVLGVDEGWVSLEGVTAPVAFAELGPGHVQVEFTRLESLADEDIGDEFDDPDASDDFDHDGAVDDDGAVDEEEDRA
jgi:ribosome maturation factor RimP